jgi:hypothetical protein
MEAGTKLAIKFTLDKKQKVAFLLIYKHLDRLPSTASKAQNYQQHCQFIGGKGRTGKSRVIKALVTLFKERGMSKMILMTATSGTTAARISGITIHSACNVTIDPKYLPRDIDGVQTRDLLAAQLR